LWQKLNWSVLGVLITLQLAGCVSSEQFYEDVSLSRDSAYRQWKSRKELQQRSETYISGKLSLEDCLKLTLANNKTLQRVVQEKEIASGERLKSYSAILPTVSLTSEYQRLEDETVRVAVQDVIYTASYAYYDVLLNQHLLEISADAVRSAEAHLNSVKQKRQGGVASDFDVLRAEVELSNFQAELIQNKNAINIAKASLIKVIGVSQDSDFVLSDELVYVFSETTMEQAVEAAYRNRPDIFSREFDIKYQTELLRIAQSRYWPTISGYYSNIWSQPDPHSMMEIEWGHAWQAGVTAALPIFDGFSREGDIIQQKARVKQAQIDLVDAEETALFELTKALLSIENAVEFVQSQRLNLTRAEEGLRLAEVGYKEGTNTQVEMIDAQAALTTARANYYQAIYSHIIARLDLQKAMGTLALFEESRGR